jgi:hypothetical protein
MYLGVELMVRRNEGSMQYVGKVSKGAGDAVAEMCWSRSGHVARVPRRRSQGGA